MTREHGTRAKYAIDRCRCFPCRVANARVASDRNRAIAYGTWRPYVDAQPAREHVRALMAAGMGWKRVADTAGVAQSTVWKLIYPTRGHGPSARCRAVTADRLLAMEWSPWLLADGAYIDGALTWRRAHSLMALGYSRCWIAQQVISPTALALQLKTKVTVRNAKAVKALYDQIGDTPAPSSPASARTINEARRKGWPRPAEWADGPDLITAGFDIALDDEPDLDLIAIERAMYGERVDLTRAERLEAVRRMSESGRSPGQISQTLSISGARVAQILDRLAV